MVLHILLPTCTSNSLEGTPLFSKMNPKLTLLLALATLAISTAAPNYGGRVASPYITKVSNWGPAGYGGGWGSVIGDGYGDGYLGYGGPWVNGLGDGYLGYGGWGLSNLYASSYGPDNNAVTTTEISNNGQSNENLYSKNAENSNSGYNLKSSNSLQDDQTAQKEQSENKEVVAPAPSKY